MYLATTIPTEVLGRLREGARSALLEPLVQYRWRVEREPERLSPTESDAALTQVCRLAGLLNALGWSADDAMPERLLDIADYGPALCEALIEAARAATVELKEAPRSQRGRVIETVLPFCVLAEVVEAACLDLASREPCVHEFQEALQILLAELERGEPDGLPPVSSAARRSRRPDGGGGRAVKECCVDIR
jgi:hypothetical protein